MVKKVLTKYQQTTNKIFKEVKSIEEYAAGDIQPGRDTISGLRMADVFEKMETYLEGDEKIADMTVVDIGCYCGGFMQGVAEIYGCNKIVGVETSPRAMIESMRRIKHYSRGRGYVAAMPSVNNITSLKGADIVYCWSYGYDDDRAERLINLAIQSGTVKIMILAYKGKIHELPQVFSKHDIVSFKFGRLTTRTLFVRIDRTKCYEGIISSNLSNNPVAEASEIWDSMSFDDYRTLSQTQFTIEVLNPSVRDTKHGNTVNTTFLSLPVRRALMFFDHKHNGGKFEVYLTRRKTIKTFSPPVTPMKSYEMRPSIKSRNIRRFNFSSVQPLFTPEENEAFINDLVVAGLDEVCSDKEPIKVEDDISSSQTTNDDAAASVDDSPSSPYHQDQTQPLQATSTKSSEDDPYSSLEFPDIVFEPSSSDLFKQIFHYTGSLLELLKIETIQSNADEKASPSCSSTDFSPLLSSTSDTDFKRSREELDDAGFSEIFSLKRQHLPSSFDSIEDAFIPVF